MKQSVTAQLSLSGFNLCTLYLLRARSEARFLITLKGRSGFVYVEREAAYCRTKVRLVRSLCPWTKN
jgi:hypothetical protein